MFSALSGCAGLPRLPSTDGISVDLITTKVQCEMAEAYTKATPSGQAVLDKYAAGVKLELKVREENILGATAKLVVPVVPVATSSLTFDGGSSLDDTSYRYTTINISASMKAIHDKFLDLNGRLVSKCDGETGFAPTSLSLGLNQWIVESILAISKPENAVALDDMSYLLEFILVREANGSISFANTRFMPANINGDAKRTRDNTLTVSFTRIPKPPEPQKIVIVGYPAAPIKPPAEHQPLATPNHIPKLARPTYRTTPQESPALSPEVKQRLDYLNNQTKFNSVISPNSQIVPY